MAVERSTMAVECSTIDLGPPEVRDRALNDGRRALNQAGYISNFNQSKIDNKNVNNEINKLTLFCAFASLFGINSKITIPKRGNATNNNNIDEYSNIILKT